MFMSESKNNDAPVKSASTKKINAVKGMNDVLPGESAKWEWLESVVRTLMASYAYRNIRTPIVEPTALFVRGLGEVTDIVEKEMYSFEDRLNGEALTLRPESTAGVVRRRWVEALQSSVRQAQIDRKFNAIEGNHKLRV